METIKIGYKEITVNELNVNDVIKVDSEVLLSVESILNAYQEWDKSTFELAIEHPKLFLQLLSTSTNLKKKFIKSLKAKDFDVLAFVFLSVNAEFFIQRLKLIEMSK